MAVASSKVFVVGLTLMMGASFGLTMVACSGKGAKTPTTAHAGDGGADGGATPSYLATTPPPSGLPPMSSMPPPGVAGSKKAKTRVDGALAACGGTSKPSAKDPADLVKRLGEACAAPSKMKPSGAPLRGSQGDKDAHQENKFHADANHCYRVYFAGDESVKDVVVIVRDSNGDIVAEAPGPAIPPDGAMCFTASDDATVLLGVGSGKGAWAAQVWSD